MTRLRWRFVLVAAIATMSSGQAIGGITILGPDTQVLSTGFLGTYANVTLNPLGAGTDVVYEASASTTFRNTLAASFPTWTFNYGGTLNGTLQVNTYDAFSDAEAGGANLTATYARAVTDPSLWNLRFIQMVSTSAPLSGTSPYIDPIPVQGSSNNDGMPFYDTLLQAADSKDYTGTTNGTYVFKDFPDRPYPTPPVPPQYITSVSWTGEVLLASYDSYDLTNKGGAVTIYDGFKWGFYIQQYPHPYGQSVTFKTSISANDKSIGRSAVPAPSSLASAFMGLLAVGFCRASGKILIRHGPRFLHAVAVTALAISVIGSDDVAKAKKPDCLLIISLPKSTYKRGEEISPDISYKNQTDRDLTIWSSGLYTNHTVVIKDEAGESLPLTSAGKQWRDLFSRGRIRDRSVPIVIKPGKTKSADGSIDVSKLYQFETGKPYTMEITYDDVTRPTPLKMKSKAVTFKVE